MEKVEFDSEKFKSTKLPHPFFVLWVLSPVTIINEFFLGQRISRHILIDKVSDAPRMDREYYPCPHCQTLHPAKLWTRKTGLFHYDGLYCPTCEEKIPCLLNIFTALILLITYPLWKPLKMAYGERFKAWELSRAPDPINTPELSRQFKFRKIGIYMGISSILVSTLVFGLAYGLSVNVIGFAVVYGAIIGTLITMSMKMFMLHRPRQKN